MALVILGLALGDSRVGGMGAVLGLESAASKKVDPCARFDMDGIDDENMV